MMGRLHNIIVIAAFAVVAAVPGGFGRFPGPMPDPGPFPGPGPGPFLGSVQFYFFQFYSPDVPGIYRPQRGSGSQTSPTQSEFPPVTQRPGGKLGGVPLVTQRPGGELGGFPLVTQRPGGELGGIQPITQKPGVELVRPTTLRTQPGSVQKHVSCGLNPSPGECQAAFPRYYYNSTTSQCDCYLFGGCDEEEGSYKSLKECHQKCHPSLKEEGPVCRLVFIDNIVLFSPPTTTSSPDANYPTENNRPATTTSSIGNRRPTTFKPTGNMPIPEPFFPTEIPRPPRDPHVAFPGDGLHSSDSDYESDDL